MHKVPTTECRQGILGFVPRSARTRAIAARTASLELSSADASEDRVAWSGTRVLTPCSSRWHVVRGMPALDASSVSVSPLVMRKSARLGSSPLPTSRAVTGSFTTFASWGMKRGCGCSRPCSQAPIRAPSATPTASATSLIVSPTFRRACLSAMPSTLLLATIRNPTGDTPSRGSSRYPCLSRVPPLQRPPDAWGLCRRKRIGIWLRSDVHQTPFWSLICVRAVLSVPVTGSAPYRRRSEWRWRDE